MINYERFVVRRSFFCFVPVLAAIFALALPASPAMAVAPSCGAGYTWASTGWIWRPGTTTYYAKQVIYSNGSKFCAYTEKIQDVGVATRVGVRLGHTGTNFWGSQTVKVTDLGSYKYYAGPIYLSIPLCSNGHIKAQSLVLTSGWGHDFGTCRR